MNHQNDIAKKGDDGKCAPEDPQLPGAPSVIAESVEATVGPPPDDCNSKTSVTISSYESLGLASNNMLPIEDVLKEIEEDKAWTHQLENPGLELALIVFLYGKGYYNDLSPKDRVLRIQLCISSIGGNRKRLQEIVFASHNDKLMSDDEAFDFYFDMATTARMLFEQNGAHGGFQGDAICRVQEDNCTCFLAAVCMWLTIKLQRDNPLLNVRPLDIGWVARRFLINEREGFEDRVLKDKGGKAVELLMKIVRKSIKQKGIKNKGPETVDCDFSLCNPSLWKVKRRCAQQMLKAHLDGNHVGLVTNFFVSDNFLNVPRMDGFGYWEFDGDSFDCEGKFVALSKDSKVEEERKRLFSLWESQRNSAMESNSEEREAMRKLLQMSPRKPRDGSAPNVNQGARRDQLVRVEVSLDDTLDALKAEVQKKLDIPKDQQKLTYKETELDDVTATLQDYQIDHKDVIQVTDARSSAQRVISVIEKETEPMHAMVLFGSIVKKDADGNEKLLYIIWNWWTNMPLAALSLDYLIACGCSINFVPTELTPDCIENIHYAEALACDCAFPDHGEDASTHFFSWDG